MSAEGVGEIEKLAKGEELPVAPPTNRVRTLSKTRPFWIESIEKKSETGHNCGGYLFAENNEMQIREFPLDFHVAIHWVSFSHWPLVKICISHGCHHFQRSFIFICKFLGNDRVVSSMKKKMNFRLCDLMTKGQCLTVVATVWFPGDKMFDSGFSFHYDMISTIASFAIPADSVVNCLFIRLFYFRLYLINCGQNPLEYQAKFISCHATLQWTGLPFFVLIGKNSLPAFITV